MTHLDLGGLDPGEIGRLMRVLADTDVEECEIQQGDYSISLKRTALPRSGLTDADRVAQESGVAEPPFVPSPAVGVFYRSEPPSDQPSIDSGSTVAEGDILGIIEVMGVPHPVRATRAGVIDDFLVEDGEAVEYGQPIVAFSD